MRAENPRGGATREILVLPQQMVASGDQLVTSSHDFSYERMITCQINPEYSLSWKSRENRDQEANFWSQNREISRPNRETRHYCRCNIKSKHFTRMYSFKTF